MFIINRCFNNIWLESQMIHVALFSFQRTTLSFEALSLQATHLLYRSFFILSRTFFFSFWRFWRSWNSWAASGQGASSHFFHVGRCLAATCIILHDFDAFVNTYSKKLKLFVGIIYFPRLFPKTKIKAHRYAMRWFLRWWRHRDLNSGHCGYEPHALANWAMPP